MAGQRQQLVDAVKTRFALILTTTEYAPGLFYQTDIGAKLTEWHLTAKQGDDLPGIDIRDEAMRTEEPENKNAGSYTRYLDITAIIELAEGADGAAEVRKAVEDVITAVGLDQKWGGLARRTIPVEDNVRVDEEGQRIGAARVKFSIEYGRAPWEP